MTTQEIDERINQLKKDMMDIDEKLDNIGDEIAALSDKVHARRWTNENIRDAKRIRLLFPHDATYKGISMFSVSDKRIIKERFVSMTKNAGEFKFENGSKDSISTILLSILSIWKQHIMYLNNEENRYLAELRDALLPDLMSGKLQVSDGQS